MTVVIQLVKLVDGRDHAYDGQYVRHYDPAILDGEWIQLDVTRDPAKAKHFASFQEAMEYYRQVSPNDPVRGDGRPNRPLTAWSVSIASPSGGKPP